MIPSEFDYVKAGSVQEAIGLLQGAWRRREGAGRRGHSLIPLLKLRLASPAVLVDISGIGDAQGDHERRR